VPTESLLDLDIDLVLEGVEMILEEQLGITTDTLSLGERTVVIRGDEFDGQEDVTLEAEANGETYNVSCVITVSEMDWTQIDIQITNDHIGTRRFIISAVDETQTLQ
jgi:hypothetical protein